MEFPKKYKEYYEKYKEVHGHAPTDYKSQINCEVCQAEHSKNWNAIVNMK